MIRLWHKVLGAMLAVLLPVGALFAWTAVREADSRLDAELGDRLEVAAELVATQLATTGDAGRLARLRPDSDTVRTRLRDNIEQLRAATDLRRLRIVNLDGEVLVDTAPFEPFATDYAIEPDAAEIDEAIASADGVSSVLFYAEDGTPYKRGYAVVVFEGEPVAIVVVEASAEYFAALRTYRSALLVGGGIATLLALLAALYLARRITAPLGDLVDAADRIQRGNLSDPIVAQRADEVGDLAKSFEAMRLALAARDEEMQVMLAGIAHEVRNPLAGMELFVGLLEEELKETTQSSDYAGRVRRELDYLKNVVEQFLAFARDRPLSSTCFEADRLTQAVDDSCQGLALTRGVVLSHDVADGLRLTGDFDAIRAVVQNLALNAVQACGEGGAVRVAVTGAEGSRRIEVSDDGPGMSAAQVVDAQRPFHTTKEKGSGLGLPLARKFVERHGGSFEINSKPGRGTTVVISLPFDGGCPEFEDGGRTMRHHDDDDGDMEMIG